MAHPPTGGPRARQQLALFGGAELVKRGTRPREDPTRTFPAIAKIHVGRHFAIIDGRDEPLVRQFSWRPTERGDGHLHAEAWSNVHQQRILMHRLILDLLGEESAKIRVRHRNGNTLDNRRENLLVVNTTADLETRDRPSEVVYGMYGYEGPRIHCPRRQHRMLAPQRCMEFQREFRCATGCAVAATPELIRLMRAAMRQAAAGEGDDPVPGADFEGAIVDEEEGDEGGDGGDGSEKEGCE